MLRQNINDLLSFIAVAREGSFTRAASQLGVSQSALSHAVKGLEGRMDVRLLTRTTRKVVPTSAGERLLQRVAPLFETAEDELAALLEDRDRPTGNFRITTTDHGLSTVLQSRLTDLLLDYPDISVEIVSDYALADIVGDKFDAAVRLGEHAADGMIAVRVGPDFRMLAVAAPAYLARRGVPKIPQDLTSHNCINLRLPTHGGLYAWEFEKDGGEVRVRVEGQMIVNSIGPCVDAALQGLGIAYVPEGLVRTHLAEGRLRAVLEDWSPPFPGYFLCYPHRRQSSAAFSLIVEALRYRD